MRKRDIPRRLLNIHVRLILAQTVLFIMLESMKSHSPYYWTTLGFLLLCGVVVFPIFASRSTRRHEVRFRNYTSPGSELLQIGACGLFLSLHFDAPVFVYIVVGSVILIGLRLMARYRAHAP